MSMLRDIAIEWYRKTFGAPAGTDIRDEGLESIMVNCNPETVSTDYDTSDKLYFEPLTVEDVLSIYAKEKPEGVVVQFGGQTPLNIAGELAQAGVKILGTPPDTIDLAEDRDRFRLIMRELGIPQPKSGMARSLDEARQIAADIGYPLMVRPSYVLGGRAMETVYDDDQLVEYLERATAVDPNRPVLLDHFLERAALVRIGQRSACAGRANQPAGGEYDQDFLHQISSCQVIVQ